jgi:hypothetical protein
VGTGVARPAGHAASTHSRVSSLPHVLMNHAHWLSIQGETERAAMANHHRACRSLRTRPRATSRTLGRVAIVLLDAAVEVIAVLFQSRPRRGVQPPHEAAAEWRRRDHNDLADRVLPLQGGAVAERITQISECLDGFTVDTGQVRPVAGTDGLGFSLREAGRSFAEARDSTESGQRVLSVSP